MSNVRKQLRELFARQSFLTGDIKRANKCIVDIKLDSYIMGGQHLVEEWERVKKLNEQELKKVNQDINLILYG